MPRTAAVVREEPDGSVTAWAQGPRADVDALIAWCREGPPYASVKSVEPAWVEEDPVLEGFEIRR